MSEDKNTGDKDTQEQFTRVYSPVINKLMSESLMKDLVNVQPMDAECSLTFTFSTTSGYKCPFYSIGEDIKPVDNPEDYLWIFPEPSTEFTKIPVDEIKRFYDEYKHKRDEAFKYVDNPEYTWFKFNFSYPLADRKGLACVDEKTQEIIYSHMIIIS